MAFDREKFIAELEAMTVLELKELVTALEDHFGVTVLTTYCFMNAIWLIIRLPPCFVWVLRTIFPSFVSSLIMNSFTHRSFPF